MDPNTTAMVAAEFDSENMTSFPNTTTTSSPSSGTLSTSLIIYILIGIIGLFGNGVTIMVLGSSKTLRSKTTNMFIINQSIIDFITSIFLIAHSSIKYNSTGFSAGTIGEIICRLWNSKVFLWGAFNASTYNLVVLTLERYFQIIYPIKHKTSFGKREALFTMGFAWIFGFLYQFALVLPTSGVVDGTCLYLKIWPNPEMGQTMGVVTGFVKYIIPLTVLIFSYSRMIIVILRKAKNDAVVPSEANDSQQSGTQDGQGKPVPSTKRSIKMHQVTRNILKTLVIVSLCFVVCWTCNQITFLLFNLGYPIDFNGDFYNFTVYLAFANCCTNPFVYALQYKHFQAQFLWLFSKKKVTPDFGLSGTTTKFGNTSTKIGSRIDYPSTLDASRLGVPN